MIILGAGMTGCLAAYAFKDAVIHEYLERPNTHSAVLRFRSDAISKLTGIPFRKVNVYKGIYVEGKFVQPDIDIMNLYSKKVTGGIHDRSISDISPTTRWIAPHNFHKRMLHDLDSRIKYGSSVNIDELDRPIISTLPLHVLLRKLGDDPLIGGGVEPSKSIRVTTIGLKKCDVYQTIYFPIHHDNVYRASITGDRLIIESLFPIDDDCIEMVLRAFRVELDFISERNKEQVNGKFNPLPDEYRKSVMYDITKENNIYSLGRHATWRKVLLDDVLGDIRKIETMMKTSAYDRMLGK